mmetsp:Transcript_3822/g.5831  ORF Transcript_3822/g.5831 Transcript_3822/m.5831 type:complete len:176 (+) Transcript_3822:36-563(+)
MDTKKDSKDLYSMETREEEDTKKTEEDFECAPQFAQNEEFPDPSLQYFEALSRLTPQKRHEFLRTRYKNKKIREELSARFQDIKNEARLTYTSRPSSLRSSCSSNCMANQKIAHLQSTIQGLLTKLEYSDQVLRHKEEEQEDLKVTISRLEETVNLLVNEQIARNCSCSGQCSLL